MTESNRLASLQQLVETWRAKRDRTWTYNRHPVGELEVDQYRKAAMLHSCADELDALLRALPSTPNERWEAMDKAVKEIESLRAELAARERIIEIYEQQEDRLASLQKQIEELLDRLPWTKATHPSGYTLDFVSRHELKAELDAVLRALPVRCSVCNGEWGHCTCANNEAIRASLPPPTWHPDVDILQSITNALAAVDCPWRIDVQNGQAVAVPVPECLSPLANGASLPPPTTENERCLCGECVGDGFDMFPCTRNKDAKTNVV